MRSQTSRKGFGTSCSTRNMFPLFPHGGIAKARFGVHCGCGGHSQEVRTLFAGCLYAPTRKKSKEYHGTLDLCRLPGGQMAKVERRDRPKRVLGRLRRPLRASLGEPKGPKTELTTVRRAARRSLLGLFGRSRKGYS